MFQNEEENNNKKVGDSITIYEVTEYINMSFGSTKETYIVSDKKLIPTHDLGPNNKRVIIEKKRIKNKENVDTVIENNAVDQTIKNTISIEKTKPIHPYYEVKKISIYPIETYERMANEGISSKDIFQNLADYYFFEKNFAKASKYYEALFKMTSELETEYFFRYAQSLKQIGDTERSIEILNKIPNQNNKF